MFVIDVNCDCGRPHRPAFGGHIPRQSQRFREDSIVTYHCNDSYRLVYNQQRVCKHGLWSGRQVVCAKPLTSDVWIKQITIFSDRISTFNTTDSYDDVYIWKADDNQKCITSDARNQQNWTFVLSKPQKIDLIAIKLNNSLIGSESIVRKGVTILLINNEIQDLKAKFKICSFWKINIGNELEFNCHFATKVKAKIEDTDKSDEIFVNFNSNIFKDLSVCSLGVYQFPQSCGRIGLPLELNVERIVEDVELEASCSDGFELVGNPRIVCSSDGLWTGTPFCKPMQICPLIEPINKFDRKVQRIEYKNAFYFNKTQMAISQTDAVHFCLGINVTNERNKSFSRPVIKYIRQCESGLWSDVDTDCDTLLIENPEFESRYRNSVHYSIIIIIIASVLIAVSLVCIAFYLFVKHKKQKEETRSARNSMNQLVEKDDNDFVAFTKNTNRLSDPYDNSIYSMIAEDSYDILNFASHRVSNTEQYDDTQVGRPYYLEILPLNDLSSVPSSVRSSQLS